MNKREIEIYNMLTRVEDFGSRNVSMFPKNSAAAEILKTLGSGVEKLSEASATHASAEAAMREAHAARAAARINARDLISRASLVSRASDNSKVRLPKSGSEHALIVIGRGIEKDAAALKKDFVRHALSLDEVIATTNTLEIAVLDDTKARTARSAALTEWNQALAEAMHALIGFDAIVANAFANDPVALASYEGVRSIKKREAEPGRRPSRRLLLESRQQPKKGMLGENENTSALRLERLKTAVYSTHLSEPRRQIKKIGIEDCIRLLLPASENAVSALVVPDLPERHTGRHFLIDLCTVRLCGSYDSARNEGQ